MRRSKSAAIVLLGVVALLLIVSTVAKAEDLFSVTATGASQTTTAGGHSMVDLVDNLVNNKEDFAGFKNDDFSANLKYGDLNNAIKFDQSFNGDGKRVVRVRIPSTGLDKSFTDGADGKSLKDQVVDYLKKDGAKQFADFVAVVNKTSQMGVMDGNPLATTALLARDQYNRFGFQRSPFQLMNEVVQPGSQGRFDIEGGVYDNAAGNGYFADLTLDSTFRFNKVIGLSIGVPISYRDLEGASIYEVGLNVALPINVIPNGGGKGGVFWTLTPSGVGAVAGSADFISGGIIWGVQGTSSLGFTIGGFTVTLANQIGYYNGVPISVADYKFETHVNQLIAKHGLQLRQAFGNFFIDAGLAYTDFLRAAAVTDYWSPSAGLGFRWGKNLSSGLRVGYTGDFGHGYNVNGGYVELVFSN